MPGTNTTHPSLELVRITRQTGHRQNDRTTMSESEKSGTDGDPPVIGAIAMAPSSSQGDDHSSESHHTGQPRRIRSRRGKEIPDNIDAIDTHFMRHAKAPSAARRVQSSHSNEPSSYYERLQAKDDTMKGPSTDISDISPPCLSSKSSSSKLSHLPRDSTLLQLDSEDSKMPRKSGANAREGSFSTTKSDPSKSTIVVQEDRLKVSAKQPQVMSAQSCRVSGINDRKSLIEMEQTLGLDNPTPRLVENENYDTSNHQANRSSQINGNNIVLHDDGGGGGGGDGISSRDLPQQQQRLSELPQAHIIDGESVATYQSHPTITDVERQAIREEAEAQTLRRMGEVAAVATPEHRTNLTKAKSGRMRNGRSHSHRDSSDDAGDFDDGEGNYYDSQEVSLKDRRRKLVILVSACALCICAIAATIVGVVIGLRDDGSDSSSQPSAKGNGPHDLTMRAPSSSPKALDESTHQPAHEPNVHPFHTDQPTVFLDPCPSNDKCECAHDINLAAAVDGGINESLWGSTSAAGFDPVTTCGGINKNGVGVWYRVQVMQTQGESSPSSNTSSTFTNRRVMASLCGSSSAINRNNQTAQIETDYDTQLSIFAGNRCDRLSCVAGNDQGGGDCEDSSRASFVLDPQTTYYIYVHGFRSSRGIFSLQMSDLPDNMACANVTDITGGSYFFGSTKGANVVPSPLGECEGVVSTAPGVWYKAEAIYDLPPGFKIMFQVSSITDKFIPLVNAYSGENCGELVCVGSDAFEVDVPAVKGTSYYALVHAVGQTVGDFAIRFGFFNGGNSIRPPDRECKDATSLPVGSTTQGFLFGLTTEVDPIVSCGNDVVIETEGNEVQIYRGAWFNTTGTGSVLRASTCNNQTNLDTRISILQGSCANLQCIDANDDRSQTFDSMYPPLDDAISTTCSTVEWFAESGVAYFVLVHMPFLKGIVTDATADVSLEQVGITDGTATTCQMARPVPIDGTVLIGTYHQTPASSTPGMPETSGPPTSAPLPCLEPSAENDESQSLDFFFWYSLVGDGQALTASTCHPGSTRDSTTTTNITIFTTSTGSCDELQCLPSDDNVVETPCHGHMSVTWQSNDGEAYRVMVRMRAREGEGVAPTVDTSGVILHPEQESKTNATALGSVIGTTIRRGFSFTVEPIVINNDCLSAIGPVPLDGGTRRFTTRSATRSSVIHSPASGMVPHGESRYPYPQCDHRNSSDDGFVPSNASARSPNGRDAWFTVVGNGFELVASTCSIHTQFPVGLSLYTGNECDSLSCADSDDASVIVSKCNDIIVSDNPLFNPTAQTRGGYMRWKSRKDELYFIRISGYDLEDDYGMVDFQVAPANERCNRPAAVNVQPFSDDGTYRVVSIDGTTEGARRHDACGGGKNWKSSPGVWYSIKGVGEEMFATTCATATASSSSVVVHEPSIVDALTNCDDLDCLPSAQSVACRQHGTVSWYAHADQTYHVLVRSFGSSFHLDVGVYDGRSCFGAAQVSVQREGFQFVLPPTILQLDPSEAEDSTSPLQQQPNQSVLDTCLGDWHSANDTIITLPLLSDDVVTRNDTPGDDGKSPTDALRLWGSYFYSPKDFEDQDTHIIISVTSDATCLPSPSKDGISNLPRSGVYFSVSVAQGDCLTGLQCLNSTLWQQQQFESRCEIVMEIPADAYSSDGEIHRIAVHFFGFGLPSQRNITDVQHSLTVVALGNSSSDSGSNANRG